LRPRSHLIDFWKSPSLREKRMENIGFHKVPSLRLRKIVGVNFGRNQTLQLSCCNRGAFNSISSWFSVATNKRESSFKCLHSPEIQSTINPDTHSYEECQRAKPMFLIKIASIYCSAWRISEFQFDPSMFSPLCNSLSSIQLKVWTHSWLSKRR
jgi:hypothetical protein